MAIKTMEELADYLDGIRFKRRLFGGADEDDVWAVIGRLQKEYRSILEASEQRSAGLIDERNSMIRSQREEIAGLKEELQRLSGLTGGERYR